MHEASTDPSGDEAGTAAGKKMPEGRRFSGDYAREMGKRRAQKRLEQAGGTASGNAAFVAVPVDEADVIVGLRDRAKTGNPQAAAQLLAWLTRFPVQQGSGEDRQDKALEDMTPDELAFAEAWALRQVNRALRKAKGLGIVQDASLDQAGRARRAL